MVIISCIVTKKGNMAIKILRNDKLWIEDNAIKQLNEFSKYDDVVDVIGLPDLHVGFTPVGVTFKTKDLVYPFFIGNDIGCGMSLIDTNMKLKKFDKEKVYKKLEDTSIYGEYSIGGGNHFAEFQSVHKIFNKELFKSLGLDRNHLYLLVHSGSRGVGDSIYRRFASDKGLDKNSEECKEYMQLHNDAIKYALHNRLGIADVLCKYLSIKNNNQLIVDCMHNGIVEYEGYIYHHKGSVSTLNEYAIIAGSRGTCSYLVKCIRNEELLYSISHGAGRKWPRHLCKGRLMSKYSKDEIKTSKLGSLVITNKKELLYEEASEAYKDIDNVIEVLVCEGVIEVIASFIPLLTYKS